MYFALLCDVIKSRLVKENQPIYDVITGGNFMKSKIKRIICILMSTMICISFLSSSGNFYFRATALTNQYTSYLRGLIGTEPKEWGAASGTQCVELAKYYIEQYFGIYTKTLALGNGNEMYKIVAARFPETFVSINYYDGFTPLPGDIISYHSSSAPSYGHAAVVYEVSGNSYKIIEQWSGCKSVVSNTKTVRAGEYGVSYSIIGVARPNAQITPSKPTLTITPGTSTKATTFTWSKSTNADWYDVRIWFPNTNDPLIYWQCKGTSLSVNLPEGIDFWANVAPVNGEHLTYTFSDNIYFNVGLGTCEPTAITQYNGHVYALYENLTNYGQAQELCKKMGGHLATITSAEENKAVASLINNSEREYWLGANDVAVEGTWVWDTGEPFIYKNWNKDDEYTEPNNYDGVEHYMTLYKNGKWNDARYGAHLYDNGNGFILEIEPQTPSVIKEYNNHIYYRFDTGMNWTEAKAYCELLGGHLVTISDEVENAFVSNLIYKDNGNKSNYWIGLYDSNGKKDYKWVDGIDNTYRLWEKEQPNCDQGIQFYAAMVRGMGDWNDLANYTEGKTGFVCEIEKSVTSVSIKSKPNKLTYYLGEKLDLTGLSLLAKHQVGDDAVVTSGFSADADMNTLGEQKVTVTYAGKSTSFTVNVICPKPVVKPQSKTDTTLNVTWTNIPVASEYAVILNGTEIARVTDAKYSFTNLNPATEYKVQVVAYKEKSVLEKSDTIAVTTAKKVTFVGEGKEDKPYLINDYEDLKCLSDMVNDELTNPKFKNSFYKQTADIDMKSQEFIPIGNGAKNNIVFAGNYDGNYHEINNLKVTGDSEYSGLFGKVGEAVNKNTNCQISNLIVNGNVNSESKYAGGIAGMLMYNSTIISSAFYGDVSATGTAGGIVGYIENGGTIDTCYHNGSVSAKNAGGVIGKITTDAQNTNSVYVVSTYHHNGKVSGTEHSGGIVGVSSSDSKTVSLYNNYYAKETANGGIDGTTSEGAKAVNDVVLASLAETLGAPYSDNSDSVLNEGAPVFRWQLPIYEFNGEGTEESPYLIRNKQELLTLAEYLNDYTLNGMFGDDVYMQTADINLSNMDWKPMASNQMMAFSGIYDGGCHKIRNLKVENDILGGFFGCVSGGTVKNLVIENGTITVENGDAGGIAAIINNNATIQDSAYIGGVTAYCAGGIAGSSSSNANIISCYQNGTVTGEAYAGGIIGLSIEGKTTLQSSYHGDGIVKAEKSGGLIGSANEIVSITNSYYLNDIAEGAVDSKAYSGAIAVNKAVLSALSTTLETPFKDNTNSDYNNGYPIFEWQNNEVLKVKLAGDTNCDNNVDIADVVILKCYLINSNSYSISEQGRINADVNNRGNGLNTQDSLAILKYILKIITSFDVV